MVESEATGLSEQEMLGAVKFGHEGFVPIINAIENLAKKLENLNGKLKQKIILQLKRK
jgi:polyribonucleotide nucleotidyltransferase